jgi:hypothetical protein
MWRIEVAGQAKRPSRKRKQVDAAPTEIKPEPTEAMSRAIEEAERRRAAMPARAAMSLDLDGGAAKIGSPHSNALGFVALLETTFGTRSSSFVNGAVLKLLKAGAERGKWSTEDEANAGLAFIAAVGPADEFEASMALQMYATNELTMEMLSRARHTEDRQAITEYGNLATKLSRTFTKARRGGEQVVKYIHVHEGGQAVVAGTINQGGRAIGKGSEQPQGQIADAPQSALSGPDPARDGVPLASDAEREVLPARWEESGRS